MQMVARGIIFADSDVLYDDSLWLRWLHALLRRECAVGNFSEFCCAWNQASLEMFTGRHTMADALQTLLENLEVPATLRSELAIVAQTRRKSLSAGCRPFPGVVRDMQALADQGFSLALLANCELTGSQLRQRLEGLGIAQFHTIVTSCDLGLTKPHPNAYLQAATQLQLAIEDVIYVGGDKLDLAGAEAIGMRTVCCVDDIGHAGWCIGSLGELAQHVSPRWPLRRTG